jgi:membrane-associated protease RseP (regulator of RpoE activity)
MGQPAGAPNQPPGGQMPWMRGGFLGIQLEDGGAFDGTAMPLVTRVTPESGLAKLGVKTGDQIAKIGITEITTAESYRTAYMAFKPGDELSLTIVRDGKTQELVGKVEAPPRPRDVLANADQIKADAAAIRTDIEKAKLRADLEDTLRVLTELQKGMPAAAAEFKKVYPNGKFNVSIHIDVSSDPMAPDQQALQPAPIPAAKPQPLPEKPAAKTP